MAGNSKKDKAAGQGNQEKVAFELEAPGAGEVLLTGSFNAWDEAGQPLKKGKSGIWKLKLKLPPGRHEYRYIVDGQWVTDPCCGETVDNGHGERNSVIVVEP